MRRMSLACIVKSVGFKTRCITHYLWKLSRSMLQPLGCDRVEQLDSECYSSGERLATPQSQSPFPNPTREPPPTAIAARHAAPPQLPQRSRSSPSPSQTPTRAIEERNCFRARWPSCAPASTPAARFQATALASKGNLTFQKKRRNHDVSPCCYHCCHSWL
jgi:hypothetical protein